MEGKGETGIKQVEREKCNKGETDKSEREREREKKKFSLSLYAIKGN